MEKELRINNFILGNYTDYGDIEDIEKQEVCKVLALDSVGLAEYSIWVEGESAYIERYDSFEGIPLTEEWFLKLGFIIRYLNEDKNKPRWWKVEGNRHIDLYFESQVMSNVFMINSLQYSIEIKYVHQLQNLYFALTGTELTHQKIN